MSGILGLLFSPDLYNSFDTLLIGTLLVGPVILFFSDHFIASINVKV